MLHILRYLCRSWGVLPASCTLQGKVEFTELPSLAHEDFCELRRGTWRSKEVVIKVMHPGASHWARDVKKELSMGPILGRHLKHRNLLPLYGVCAGVKFTDSGKSTEHPYPCFVVPWMKNGNIRDFVRKNTTFDRFKLLVDVCEGLNYLHSEGFAHGCLDWQSVLVDDEQRACLADFCFRGALGFSEAYFPATTTLDGFSVSGIYMAPERLASPAAPTRKPTDVHELGTLILEVLTFDQSWRDVVEFPITGNLKPPSWVPIPDHPIWDLVKRCWIREPEKRPQMAEILETLTSPGMTFPMVWPLPVTPASPSPPSDSISS
ncbi:kinase-like domain-containing protein [Thelephora terrestris]|uniref:Kinase-like domain-containing protein n=1 Tax=Thelephora terrestris TaxID=56493 RepID=A0A9P6H8K4_9AGAM|nr:kinase-like domain-containing protein [Thelephora terrestris]